MKSLFSKTKHGELHAFQVGDPAHDTLVFMHGLPGSHRQGLVFQEHAEALKLRVIAFDRPGYALSAPVAKPNLKNFTRSVEEFLDEHKIDDFYLVGISGGNPAAVSAAVHFGKRVRAFGSICGLAPFYEFRENFSPLQQLGLHAANLLPQKMLEKIVDLALADFNSEKSIDRFRKRLDKYDQEILSQPKVRQILVDSMNSARSSGSKGIVFDLKTIAKSWDAQLQEIKCPYLITHGKEDKILSYAMSVKTHGLIPHSKLKLFENEGHYSLPLKHGRELLTALLKEA